MPLLFAIFTTFYQVNLTNLCNSYSCLYVDVSVLCIYSMIVILFSLEFQANLQQFPMKYFNKRPQEPIGAAKAILLVSSYQKEKAHTNIIQATTRYSHVIFVVVVRFFFWLFSQSTLQIINDGIPQHTLRVYTCFKHQPN